TASLLRVLDVAIQFAWGLDYAHQRGLLHLDVKPANVMMSGPNPKVTDFGLAQATTADSLSQGLVVDKWEGMTPGFCSPEQYQAYLLYREGKKSSSLRITAQSDIWSWAISVLAMFHGRAPCRKGGQTAAKVFEMFLEVPAPDDRPVLPKNLIELMRHCFQEDPKDRPRSMSEVAERLIEVYQEASGETYPRTVPSATRLTTESLNNQAVSLLDLNKFKEAELLFHEALKKHPWQPELTYNQSLHLWRHGELTDLEAVDQLETLVKIHGEPISWFALGLVQRARGNTASARQAFETALELKARPAIRKTLEKALATVEKITDCNVRCTDRFTVNPQNGPIAFLDEKEEILLMAGNSSPFFAYDLKQGRMWLTFKTPEKSAGQCLALSEDFQWELFYGKTPTELVLKSVTNPTKHFKLNAVPWGKMQQNVVGTFAAPFWAGDLTARGLSLEMLDPSEAARTQNPRWNLQLVDKFHEIHVMDRSRNRLLKILRGHEDEVVSISHGGRHGEWVLTGSRDRTVRLWELPSGRCVRTFSGRDASVDAVYLSRNGRFLLTLLKGNLLRLWDIGVLCHHSEQLRAPVLLCQISSSEEMSRQQSETFALQEKLKAAIDREDFSTATSFVKEIRNLSSWEIVRRELPWEILSQKCIRETPVDAVCLHTLTGHEDIVSTVALSLDGQLAVSAGKDQTIRLWNTLTGKCVKVLTGHQDWIRDIALTWDGRYILSGSWDTTVRVWNTGTGKCARTFNDRIPSINRLALHPSRKLAAIATAAGSVLLWNIVEDRLVGNWFAHQGAVNTIAFNRDGRYLLTGGDDATICFWDTATQYLVRKHSRGKLPITAVKIAPDLQEFVDTSKEGAIEIHNFAKRGPARILAGHVAEITGLELFADNRFFATTSKDQTVKIWNLANGSLQKTLSGHSGPITGLAMDFSGRKMLTCSEDGTLRFWELFWDLSYCETPDWNQRATSLLHALLSLYCNDANPASSPQLEERDVQRILLEFGYRGFGHLRPDIVYQEIRRMLKYWTGPIVLPATGGLRDK
ncbi:MAG: protein kinase, partial [Planctomycetaceae bacterium]|nr:protein kinase [Planctomycetaceae bacterium]